MHERQENDSRVVWIHLFERGITSCIDGLTAGCGIRSLRWHEDPKEPIEVARSGGAVVCDEKALGIEGAD